MSINVGCKESSIKTFFNKSEKVNKDNEDIKKYDNYQIFNFNFPKRKRITMLTKRLAINIIITPMTIHNKFLITVS